MVLLHEHKEGLDTMTLPISPNSGSTTYTPPISSTSASSSTSTSGANNNNVSNALTNAVTGTNSLGENAFLQLLVTQMQHQDPTQPQSNTQFIAQLAQFTSVEQMTNVATTNNQLEAFQLLGHTVAVKYNGNSDSGVVTSIATNNGSPILSINGNAYPLSSVVAELK